MSEYILDHDDHSAIDFTITSPVIQETLVHLSSVLPSTASGLIRQYQDMSIAANRSFAQNPDDPAEHAPNWHQYGILTHSARFGDMLRDRVPIDIAEWGLTGPLQAALVETIDGIPKAQLLSVGALAHDLGKFTARTVTYTGDGMDTDFTNHETHSGKIIQARRDLMPGLTQAQVGYVATCAALHFELGKVRRAAKAGGGYTIAFAGSSAFSAIARGIMRTYPAYAPEIGLEFIADNLAKSEVIATGRTDESVAAERAHLDTVLQERELSPRLINQALQVPTNLAVARRYLSIWAEES
jgi:hypothetical protein